MPSFLINKKDLIKYDIQELLSFCDEKSNHDIGLIIIVPNKQYNKLMSETEKIGYIRSESFIKNINATYIVFYSKNKKICEIM